MAAEGVQFSTSEIEFLNNASNDVINRIKALKNVTGIGKRIRTDLDNLIIEIIGSNLTPDEQAIFNNLGDHSFIYVN